MILVGRFQSPFVRRAAVTLKHYGLNFEHKALSSMTDKDAVKTFNPLGRVPAFVTDEGDTIVDSAVILDHLDELAGPSKSLTPPKGKERRKVLHAVAVAVGACEKAVGGLYEKNRRPAEKVHQPWLDQLDGQAKDGLDALEAMNPSPFLCGSKLTQADVTAVCVFDFMRGQLPHLAPAGRYPKLEALSKRCNEMPAFAETVPKG
ncbi:MAG: glutathione S-transferase family protein [Alphaproteobacteria bacterium]|nr:glutathione S-transferase family protein [Alphaproteobacteria bacterium]